MAEKVCEVGGEAPAPQRLPPVGRRLVDRDELLQMGPPEAGGRLPRCLHVLPQRLPVVQPLRRPGHVVQLGDDGVDLGKVLRRVGDVLRVDGYGRSVRGEVGFIAVKPRPHVAPSGGITHL